MIRINKHDWCDLLLVGDNRPIFWIISLLYFDNQSAAISARIAAASSSDDEILRCRRRWNENGIPREIPNDCILIPPLLNNYKKE
jgi:hypothetical protein